MLAGRGRRSASASLRTARPPIRSLHPSFPLRLQHLGVHAQNLALLLPLVCDDAGRVRLEHRKICDVLYPGPGQNDMAAQLDGLIVELEQEGWVERYSVDGADYGHVTFAEFT